VDGVEVEYDAVWCKRPFEVSSLLVVLLGKPERSDLVMGEKVEIQRRAGANGLIGSMVRKGSRSAILELPLVRHSLGT
jgi:hypothetical protein